MFIGREQELAVLEHGYRARASALIPVYGRRRVGKSELILRFLDGRPGIYFLGKTAPPALQMSEFLQVAAAALDEPLLSGLAPTSWKDILQTVVGRWRGRGKLVIAMDEF